MIKLNKINSFKSYKIVLALFIVSLVFALFLFFTPYTSWQAQFIYRGYVRAIYNLNTLDVFFEVFVPVCWFVCFLRINEKKPTAINVLIFLLVGFSFSLANFVGYINYYFGNEWSGSGLELMKMVITESIVFYAIIMVAYVLAIVAYILESYSKVFLCITVIVTSLLPIVLYIGILNVCMNDGMSPIQYILSGVFIVLKLTSSVAIILTINNNNEIINRGLEYSDTVSYDKKTSVEMLKMLKAEFDSGKLSYDEYQRKRKEILDNL